MKSWDEIKASRPDTAERREAYSRTRQLCPRCNGQGHTFRPPWVPGDQPTWDAVDTRSYPCPPCSGTGILP